MIKIYHLYLVVWRFAILIVQVNLVALVIKPNNLTLQNGSLKANLFYVDNLILSKTGRLKTLWINSQYHQTK